MNSSQKILVAPLNWGLGHATRCIPIIKALQKDGFEVLIGGDGSSLELLKIEFPNTPTVSLPSYHIKYPRKKKYFKTKLLLRSPKIVKAIKAEQKLIEKLVDQYQITGIISDNRLGLYTDKVPSVFLTHQLQVLSGNTTALTTYLHHRFIKHFDECWVPDFEGAINLSGQLGHPKNSDRKVKYIGPISRLKKQNLPIKYDAMVLLSGPEPQRSLLEKILLHRLKMFHGRILFVQGLIEEEQQWIRKESMTMVNFLTTSELETAMNESAFVIARSGYTTIMDLAALGKKAFFIPTPGQSEQEYLAQRLKDAKVAPMSEQDDFKIRDLARLEVYSGFEQINASEDLGKHFGLFQSKGELGSNSKFTLNVNSFIVGLNDMLHYRKSQT